jgi:hypothetical protein
MMNKKIFSIGIFLSILTLASTAQIGNTGLSVKENVNRFFSGNSNIPTLDFLLKPNDNHYSDLDSFISNYTVLNLNAEILNLLFQEKNDLLRLNIPINKEDIITLNLVRYELTNNDTFTLKFLNANSTITESAKNHTGYHYRGILENYPGNNWCSVSLFKDEVSILIATENGNINIGRIPKTSNYIVYNDIHVKNVAPFECGSTDDTQIELSTELTQNEKANQPHGDDAIGQNNSEEDIVTVNENCPVSLKWVFDYSFFLGALNSGLTTSNYIISLFNNVALIYQNENISLMLNTNTVWLYNTSTPPFVNYADPNQTFLNFGYLIHQPSSGIYINEMSDDIAMFIQTNPQNLLSIAVIDAFCTNYSINGNQYHPGQASGKFALSSIEPTWQSFPYYSWSVSVVSHEMGHNFGSRHTHWCGWQGGPIDGCVAQIEPNNDGTTCFSNYIPSLFETTIMSYCHQIYGSINLANGFGPFPGNKIRERYMESCFCRTVGVEDVNNTSALTIFPNPANKILNLNLEGIKIAKGANLRIFNSIGDIVLSKYYSNDISIDISFLPDGIYILNLQVAKNTEGYNSRFIVVR